MLDNYSILLNLHAELIGISSEFGFFIGVNLIPFKADKYKLEIRTPLIPNRDKFIDKLDKYLNDRFGKKLNWKFKHIGETLYGEAVLNKQDIYNYVVMKRIEGCPLNMEK